MACSLIVLGALAAAAAAQSTTVSVLLPMLDSQALVGSVVAAGKDATTFAISCPSGEDPDECGLSTSATITQGPSTWALTTSYSADDGDKGVQDMACSGELVSSMSCVISVSQEFDGISTQQATSDVLSSTLLTDAIYPVTVTAGADKLGDAAPGATATETQSSVPSTAAETTGTTAAPTASETGSQGAAETTSNTDNAALPQATQQAVVAGVAAVVGGALVL